LKIVYLSASNIPSRTANSVQVMKMCAAFARNGHRTVLVCRHYGQPDVGDVYEYYGVGGDFAIVSVRSVTTKGAGILALPRVRRVLRQYDAEDHLVYARDIYGATLAARMGYRVVYESHGLPYNRLIGHLERSLFRSPGFLKLVVISNALGDLYAARFKMPRTFAVCHDAADVPSSFGDGDYTWPCNRNGLQIGYVGHLYEGRGIDIILECARRLPEHDFHIVGGTERDVDAWRKQGPANVYFHGYVSPRQTSVVRSKCDVLLMPYQAKLHIAGRKLSTSSWMSPLKLFEYMSSGKAIIASALPVIREVLNGDNSILVPPDDVETWVDALRQCESPACRLRLGANAYNCFLAKYTWDRRVDEVLRGVAL